MRGGLTARPQVSGDSAEASGLVGESGRLGERDGVPLLLPLVEFVSEFEEGGDARVRHRAPAWSPKIASSTRW